MSRWRRRASSEAQRHGRRQQRIGEVRITDDSIRDAACRFRHGRHAAFLPPLSSVATPSAVMAAPDDSEWRRRTAFAAVPVAATWSLSLPEGTRRYRRGTVRYARACYGISRRCSRPPLT